ncbi:Fe2+-dependent dioxygenase [Massilia sp. CCM 8695]|uniref:Fe2+-dependent dioxygenase n=1 Tax=Massilia frigida TaxID=2609281 RepID=A0ABX0NH77_9BURK|nr:Fe2+-dependent dioxygenase [Massilia frigida]NHZ82519.1 Fe2+-dependent dioxygenase [Massilia frigida]
MLTILDAVLSKDEVRQFRVYLDQAEWRDGAATAGTLARSAKNNAQIDDGADVAVSLGNHILRTLGNTPLFIAAALPRKIYPPKFNRYAVGATYGTHVDSAVMQIPNTHLSLRSDLAATLFLSEPDEYDGGELEIDTEFGVQTVKLGAGDMVLYPASSLHRVTPVTRGARVASFFWIESLVGDDAERTLLFDLDQTIQNLTQGLAADDRKLLKLTGIYHNLLRRWAAT